LRTVPGPSARNAVRASILTAALVTFAVPAFGQDAATTQQEFVQKSGSGRVVVMVSGQTGPANYAQSAQELADAGFDVVLYDGNQLWIKDTQAAWTLLKGAITRAEAGPHAQPGKAAVVAYSLGGAAALTYATRMPELVETVVGVLSVHELHQGSAEFVGKMKVPVPMLV